MINKKIKCLFGFHEWESFQSNFTDDYNNVILTICWQQCEHCAKTKIKHTYGTRI